MDEAARTGSKALSGSDLTGVREGEESPTDERTPEEIQADIERTRRELGDTAEALAAKADVKGQAKAKVNEVRQTARAKTDVAFGKIKDTSPESANAGAQQVSSAAQENPLPFVAAGSFAAGILVGWAARRG